jgi:hypothetical protein
MLVRQTAGPAWSVSGPPPHRVRPVPRQQDCLRLEALRQGGRGTCACAEALGDASGGCRDSDVGGELAALGLLLRTRVSQQLLVLPV